jgi:hypothetical protein
MARIRNRLRNLRLALALAAMAPLGFAHAQSFSSVSSGAPKVAVAAPSGAATDATRVPVAAVSPPVAGVPAGQAHVEAPVTASSVPILASAGTVSPAIPAPAVAVPAPAAPVRAASGTFSSSSGSFGSVSGGAPALPVPPAANVNFGAGSAASYELADKVVVVKHERALRLFRRGQVIAEYPIKLGLNPYGHKRREGDFRTPEGKYELVARNPQSEFFLSIKISYPNREDAAVASENGHAPGGLIMIHGQPNEPKKPPQHYATKDWTDGCIALSNADMVDVWLRTSTGIPIEIRP